MKVPRSTLDPVYQAAARIVDAGLRNDSSVFTPEAAVWTLQSVEDLHELFVVRADTSKDSFNTKLLRQLDGANPATVQLAAEMLFWHSLGVSNQGETSKRAMIEPLLDTISVTIPDSLGSALKDGVAHHGAGLAHRDGYVKFLVEFLLSWKQLEEATRTGLLADPHGFRSFVFKLQEGKDNAQRNMLIHLVFPDVFEPIASPYAKRDIADHYAELVSDPEADLDTRLGEIRQALSGKYGTGFMFYDDEIQNQWGSLKPSPPVDMTDPVQAIASMIEDRYPEEDLRQLLLGLAADAIETAHEAGPRSWGFGPDAKLTYLSLNVGRLATIGFNREWVTVGLSTEGATDRLLAQLDEASPHGGGFYHSLPTSRFWRLDPDRVPSLLDQIGPHLDAHIRNAVAAVSVTPYARFHSTAAIEYLSSSTGRDLPAPDHRRLPETRGMSGWDGLVAWCARMFDEERFDEWERNYKLAIGARIAEARSALQDGRDGWWQLLRTAFTKDNNLTPWQQHSKFYQWAREAPDAAAVALMAIWDESVPVADRIRGFTDALPLDVVAGTGTRLAIASFLLMADPTEYPIYRPTPFQEAWRLTQWQEPPNGADEATTYAVALGFMDELRAQMSGVGVETRDRLDAQGLIWSVVNWREAPEYLAPDEQALLKAFRAGDVHSIPEPDEPDDQPPTNPVSGYVEPTFDEILERVQAAGFRITPDTLLRFHLSLKTRGFVILSGISGTGKSWLTRLYSKAIDGAFLLVPVAPNWTTNEDLLGFHNPVTNLYVDTDFSRFLRAAATEYAQATEAGVAARPYLVVLDEMNLARVEYYFARFLSIMEARLQGEGSIELGPDESIPLPPNLVAIGTVNVDETTHGFADKVYDRAQVIELPLTENDVAAHIGDVPHAELLIQVWTAVAPVVPFAYRVVDEIESYIATALEAGLEWEDALDHQVLQKVLPRMARADDQVGSALLALISVCEDRLPLSAGKATAMHEQLEEHGFASYF